MGSYHMCLSVWSLKMDSAVSTVLKVRACFQGIKQLLFTTPFQYITGTTVKLRGILFGWVQL